MTENASSLPSPVLDWAAALGSGEITRLERHVARREAWVIDIEDTSGNVTEGFLRIDRNPRDSDHISLRREADICRSLHPLGIPVPALLGWNEEYHAALFSREPGSAAIDALDDPQQQRRVMEDFIAIIARVHQLDEGELSLDRALGDKPTTAFECALDDVDRQLKQFQGFLDKYTDPLISYSVQWLRRYAPTKVERICLVQGDTGPVNFMFEGDKVTAVVDWEWGHWGDPMEDLGNICVREFWNPSGGLKGLFKRYQQISGIPYSREAAMYYRVQQNVRGMIPIHAACNYMPEGHSLAWYLCYRYLGDRSTCEALAESMDIAIERPEFPSELPTSNLGKAISRHLTADIEPALDGDFARSRARDIAILNECMERDYLYGGQIRATECEEISALLGKSICDYDAAMDALDHAILAGELADQAVLPYLARRAYRDEWLYWPVTRLYPNRSWSELD